MLRLQALAARLKARLHAHKPALPEAAPAAAARAQPSIGRFAVVRALGRGAQGAVYLAQDPLLDRLVAVKLVTGAMDEADAAGGWARARNLARLRHPNIVSLYETGKFQNFVYLVFEYLEGTTLAEELKAKGPLSPGAAGEMMLQLTEAMAHAHGQGILHLDLNPNNIMRDKDGKPRIMDFDLSRRASDVPAHGGLVAGTLMYMAPECVTDGRFDKRSDVFALGRILYALLTGPLSPPTGSAEEMIAAAGEAALDWGALQRADPGGHLADLVRRATARDPDKRFPDARAMHAALVAAVEKMREAAAALDPAHGTVAFLLKRIERRGDFPAMSRTLAEINRLAGDPEASVARITAVVLRDFALTNRLLRLANSAFYLRPAGKVSSVSEAVAVLGIDRVRLVCNSLACFGHFAGKDRRLKEEAIASFIAGLVARHLAVQAGIRETEEAFLAGMLFNLGKALSMYYFPEDYDEIDKLAARGLTLDEAARVVLGVTLLQLGRAVGEVWSLPPVVLGCMLDEAPAEEDAAVRRMRSIVRFANALVEPEIEGDPLGAGGADVRALVPGRTELIALLRAATEKFKSFAPALEVNFAGSTRVQSIERWLTAMVELDREASESHRPT